MVLPARSPGLTFSLREECAGALGLILSVVALVKLSSIKKEVDLINQQELPAKISTLEGDVRNATAANEKTSTGFLPAPDNVANAGLSLQALRKSLCSIHGKFLPLGFSCHTTLSVAGRPMRI